MAREFKYPDDLTRQRYLVESYNKERDTRLRWYFNTYKTKQGSDTKTNKQYEVMLRKLQAACPKPTEELRQLKMKKESRRNVEEFQVSDSDNSVKLPQITDSTVSEPSVRTHKGSPDTLPSLTGDMKPVDDETFRRIYEGLSREGNGRYGYLKTRNSVGPEVKYQYPVVSSWEYGWRLGDVIKVEDLKNPEFGRSRIVADTFYRNNLNEFSQKM